MADDTLGEFGFDVDTTGIAAGTDALAKLEKGADAAAAAIARLDAANARAMRNVSPAMMAAMGPSPAGGSMAGTMGVAGLSAAQLSAMGASATALTTALHAPVAPLGSLAAAVQAATASLHAFSQVPVPPRGPAPSPASSPTSPSPAPSSPGSRPSSGGGGSGHGSAGSSSHGGGASYGNTLQMMELAHVGRALFDEMAAGGNILRGLAMEFGRLQIAVSAGEGGITGMLGRVAGFAGKLANPLALVTGSALALGAASVYGFSRYEEGQESLERALNTRGRYSGLTMDTANRLAGSSAATGGLSVAEGTSLTAAALGAGLSRDATGSVVEMSRDFGRLTGKGTDDAGKFLTAALADPVRGLGDLSKTLGGVDDRLKAQIEDLTRSGHLEAAQSLELQAVSRAMHEASESTFSFSRAMSGAGNWISNTLGSLGHGVANALGYGSDQDNLTKNRGLLAQLQTFDPVGNAPDIAALRQEIARLEVKVAATDATAAMREREGRAIVLSGRAGDAVRSILPEIMKQRSATDTVELLRQTLADPLVMSHLDPSISPAMVGRAYSQANVLESMSRPGVRERQDYELGLSRIRDSGVQDQGLNVARQAELSVLRETGDVMRGATAAQRAYNLELSKAQESADELARSSKQRFDLIGLSPFDRAMKEVDQKYLGDRGVIESYKVDSTRAMDDKDISGDLKGGMRILSAAQEAAGSITAAGAHLVQSVDAIATKLDVAAGRIGPAEAAGRQPFGTLDRGAFGGGTGRTGQPMFALMDRAIAAGATPAAAAGFAAGTSMESGTSLNPAADNGSHLGVAQWDSTRWRDLVAKLGGARMSTQAGQFDGIFSELGSNEPGAGRMLLSGRSIADGIGASDAYERPGDAEAARRRGEATSRANALLAQYQGTPVSAAQAAAGPAASLTIAARDASTAPLHYTGDKSAVDAYGTDKAGIRKSYLSDDPSAFGTPLGDATRRLKEQAAMTDLQAGSYGKLEMATRSAVEGQKLWQSYVDNGAEKTIKLSDATGGLADAVKRYGQSAAEAAAKAEDLAKSQHAIVEASDFARGGASSVLSGGLLSAAHGQGFGKGAKSALESFGESLLNKGVSGGVNMLTGGAGNPLSLFGGLGGGTAGTGGFGSYGPQLPSAGGGILSSLISMLPHFAGGTADAPAGPTVVGEDGPEVVEMPQHAQVASNGQAQGWMQGRGGGSNTFHIGGPTIMVQGDVSEQNRAEIQRAVAAGQQQTVDHITRNLPQLQSDSRQHN